MELTDPTSVKGPVGDVDRPTVKKDSVVELSIQLTVIPEADNGPPENVVGAFAMALLFGVKAYTLLLPLAVE